MNISDTKIEAIQALQKHLAQRTIDAIADAKQRDVILTDNQLRLIIDTEKELCNQLIAIEVEKDYDKTFKRYLYITLSLATLILLHAMQSLSLSKVEYIRQAMSLVVVYIAGVIIYCRSQSTT